VSFAAVTLCVASQRVFIVVVDFVIDTVRKLLDTPPYAVTVMQHEQWLRVEIRPLFFFRSAGRRWSRNVRQCCPMTDWSCEAAWYNRVP
jgi:hypothetical protein